MSKEYYKKMIVDLRAKIVKEKEQKKKDNENYARYIANASNASVKASYRKRKIDTAASHDKDVEHYKKQIESCKQSIARIK